MPHLREGYLYFVFAVAFALAVVLALFLPLFLPLFVLRRHSERSEESPHFRGERSDPSAFLQPPPRHRHFDRSCSQSYREPRSGETHFSPHHVPANACSVVSQFDPKQSLDSTGWSHDQSANRRLGGKGVSLL